MGKCYGSVKLCFTSHIQLNFPYFLLFYYVLVEPTTSPTFTPSLVPTELPSRTPTNDFNCGCSSCTSYAWDNDANGSSCGSRIDWLQTANSERVGGPYDEYDSCRKVSGEFPEECGQFCDPEECQLSVSFNDIFIRNLRGSE